MNIVSLWLVSLCYVRKKKKKLKEEILPYKKPNGSCVCMYVCTTKQCKSYFHIFVCYTFVAYQDLIFFFFVHSLNRIVDSICTFPTRATITGDKRR